MCVCVLFYLLIKGVWFFVVPCVSEGKQTRVEKLMPPDGCRWHCHPQKAPGAQPARPAGHITTEGHLSKDS